MLESPIEQRKKAFKAIIEKYGFEYACKIEQAVRNESRHFKSAQWKECKTPGMRVMSDKFPYAWSSLEQWRKMVDLSKESFSKGKYYQTKEGKLNYIVFPSEYFGILFFAWFIKNKRAGNVAMWYRSGNKPSDNPYRDWETDRKSTRLNSSHRL